MPIAAKSGKIIIKDTRLATTCACCFPCGCTDSEQYTAIKNKLINITFLNFQFTGRLGIAASCGYCDYENSFDPSSAQVSAWSSHFNGITVTLAFDSFTNSSLIWKGSSPVMSSPSGGTVQYFYTALANCFGGFYLSSDTSMGCQQNTGWDILTAANATESPIAFAPSISTGSFGPPSTTCGSLSLPGTVNGNSGSQVFCARAESSGCLGADGCAEFYRWRFGGRFQATIETNELP